jgi:hypothetical protein
LEGVKASKKRLPKLPRAPQPSDLEEQSSIYLRERNKMMRLKLKAGFSGKILVLSYAKEDLP